MKNVFVLFVHQASSCSDMVHSASATADSAAEFFLVRQAR